MSPQVGLAVLHRVPSFRLPYSRLLLIRMFEKKNLENNLLSLFYLSWKVRRNCTLLWHNLSVCCRLEPQKQYTLPFLWAAYSQSKTLLVDSFAKLGTQCPQPCYYSACCASWCPSMPTALVLSSSCQCPIWFKAQGPGTAGGAPRESYAFFDSVRGKWDWRWWQNMKPQCFSWRTCYRLRLHKLFQPIWQHSTQMVRPWIPALLPPCTLPASSLYQRFQARGRQCDGW